MGKGSALARLVDPRYLRSDSERVVLDDDVSTLSVVLDPPVALPADPVALPDTEPGVDGSGERIWLPSAPVLGPIWPVGELVLDERPSWLGISFGVVAGEALPCVAGDVVVVPP